MKWKDIDWFNDEITWRSKGTEAKVPMQEKLRGILLDRKNEIGEAWKPDAFIVQITRSTLSHEITRLKKELGIEKEGSAHALRHAFALKILESGGDAADIKNILGHEDLSTTTIYINIYKEREKKIFKRMDRSN